MAQCTATTRAAVQCKNEAVRQHLCALHFGIEKAKPSWWQRHGEGIKTPTEADASTAALLELIKASVELWRCLPFGPAPTSPPPFRKLNVELFVGPAYPRMLREHIAFNKSHESMAWEDSLSIDELSKRSDDQDAEKLAALYEQWISERPQQYQYLLNVLLTENMEDEARSD